MGWVPLAETPALWRFDDFLSPPEQAAILDLLADPSALRSRALHETNDGCGWCIEVHADAEPRLRAVRDRVAAALQLPLDAAGTVRIRRYTAGQGHPPHTDAYTDDGLVLAYSAILYLGDASGGETTFPRAHPAPVTVAPVAGRLAAWTNLTDAGRVEPRSLHRAEPVLTGEKIALLVFFWLPVP